MKKVLVLLLACAAASSLQAQRSFLGSGGRGLPNLTRAERDFVAFANSKTFREPNLPLVQDFLNFRTMYGEWGSEGLARFQNRNRTFMRKFRPLYWEAMDDVRRRGIADPHGYLRNLVKQN